MGHLTEKLFEVRKIAEIDHLTSIYEPIADIDLMERAACELFCQIDNIAPVEEKLHVFCGPGNNGGDGLALARQLSEFYRDEPIEVYMVDLGRGLTALAAKNLKRLEQCPEVNISAIKSESDFPLIDNDALVIDALFGTGLSRPLDGLAASLVKHINSSGAKIVSVDMPSGLMGEDNRLNNEETIIKATRTLTFQFPKLSFFFSENEKFVGDFTVLDIDLHPLAIAETETKFFINTQEKLSSLLKKRSKFAHKGNFGHALLIAGAYSKMGAAVLSANACLRAGVGLLTVHVPHLGYPIIQSTVPEAMTSIDESDLMFTSVNNLHTYSAIGVGPGIGTKVNTKRALMNLIEHAKAPLVIDADAINILSENKDWIELLPPRTILTPHPKEFDRLCGNSDSSYERMLKAIEFAQTNQVIIVLKGAFTQIVNSDGRIWFNMTGNPGMATAGSGDVLTGIILAMLAAGYQPLEAARLAVFLHGCAGDYAAKNKGYESLIASDIVDYLGKAFMLLHQLKQQE
jgi:ADP-dependent NAD(P)H-hydrate dehydratase / NAD(P)H-hydrate epimerase